MYLVIETFGGLENAAIVTDQDGNNKVFHTKEDAQKEADECQNGLVVSEYPIEYTVGGWCVDDILMQAAEDEVELTEEQARGVLDMLLNKADISVGISLETISQFIEMYLEDEEEKQKAENDYEDEKSSGCDTDWDAVREEELRERSENDNN